MLLPFAYKVYTFLKSKLYPELNCNFGKIRFYVFRSGEES